MTEPRTYHLPPDVDDPGTLREQASRRRRALDAGGCQSYVLGMRSGYSVIVCLCCGLGSANISDISEKYCGFCRTYHGEWRPE